MTEQDLQTLWDEAKARIGAVNATKRAVRTQARAKGVPFPASERSEAVSEQVAFDGLKAASAGVEAARVVLAQSEIALEAARTTFGAVVDEKVALIVSETGYWQTGLQAASVPAPAPAPVPTPTPPVATAKLSLKAGKRTFKGEAAHIAAALDAHLSAPDGVLDSIRAVPPGWKPTDAYPAEYIRPNGRRLAFGANPVQRGALSGYGMVNYFNLLTTGDERCVLRSAAHLGKALAGLTVGGGVGTTADDGWLGWPYGMSSLSAGASAGAYTALEAALLGGAGSHARVLWENPTPERLEQVNRYRAFYWLHHVPRWVKAKGAPTDREPTYTRRNFAHSNLSEALNALQIAIIETGMFRAGMTKPVTVTLPDGFDSVTKRTVPGGGDGRTVSLVRGTSADLKTHPGYKQAVAIFRQFNNGKTIRTAYEGDIKDPEMRRLYGVTGCMYWDQTTLAPRFTANSGYNQMSYGALVVLSDEGVIADVLRGQDKADAFMTAVAGGCSVGMLPERFVSQGKTAYVFDDPLDERVSNAYLLNGQDVRAFGGGTVGNETDDSPEWDAELYGLPAAWDPADRIAPKTAELRAHAIAKWDKDPTAMAGGLVSRLYSEIRRGRAG